MGISLTAGPRDCNQVLSVVAMKPMTTSTRMMANIECDLLCLFMALVLLELVHRAVKLKFCEP